MRFLSFRFAACTDEQLDFLSSTPVPKSVCESEHEGHERFDGALFDAIIEHIHRARYAGVEFKMLVANLDYSEYLGRIAFGKIVSGKVKVADQAAAFMVTAGKRSKITAIFILKA